MATTAYVVYDRTSRVVVPGSQPNVFPSSADAAAQAAKQQKREDRSGAPRRTYDAVAVTGGFVAWDRTSKSFIGGGSHPQVFSSSSEAQSKIDDLIRHLASDAELPKPVYEIVTVTV